MALLPAPDEPDALYLVDLSGWARACAEVAGVDAVVRGCFGKLVRLLVDQEPAHLAFAGDTPGPTWHHALWPGYHQGRPAPSMEYLEQLEIFVELLGLHRIPVFRAPGFQADDLIAAAVTRARADGLRVVIVSRDQDLWQLLDEQGNVIAWDGKAPEAIGAAEVRARYHGVGPALLADLMALVGNADEAPGIDGIGEKTAAKLLLKRGSLDEVLRKTSWERGALEARLREGAEAARLSRRLVELRADAPIRWSLEELAVGWSEEDAAELRRIGGELGITKLASVQALPKRTTGLKQEDGETGSR